MRDTWRMVAALVVGAALAGCEDELDQSCAVTEDCKLMSDCCEGCKAINVNETVPPCDDSCVVSPCVSKYGSGADLVVVCLEGACEVGIAAQ